MYKIVRLFKYMKILPEYLPSKLPCEIVATVELCDETEKVNLLSGKLINPKSPVFSGAHVHLM